MVQRSSDLVWLANGLVVMESVFHKKERWKTQESESDWKNKGLTESALDKGNESKALTYTEEQDLWVWAYRFLLIWLSIGKTRETKTLFIYYLIVLSYCLAKNK